MASFDTRRLDGDPTYAPGRTYDKGTPWWRPPARDVKAGFGIRAYNLSALSEDDQCAKCRELTRELLQWRDGVPKLLAGTWGWIIARYKSDDLSPFKDVKANTQRSYLEELAYWEEAVGKLAVAETTFEVLKRLKKGMEANERTVSFIHRKFTHLRMVANYGLAVKPVLFRDVCAIFSSGSMKIRSPKPRDVAPTGAQVTAVIEKALAAGETGFALGISLQWWLALRPVDVRGQWLPDDGSRRWADGLTWDMVDLRTGIIRKFASKTERYDGRIVTYDLNPIPQVLAMLAAIPESERIGPVIKRNRMPFEKETYTKMWRRFAAEAGLPPEVQMRDTRAGAITDGQMAGATDIELQHQAGHLDFKTTQRYIRGREHSVQKVIQLRAGK